ncbi:MAG: glycosyltransferase family 39 protein [Epsilonproteobacteria bacterium]|nr:glycosyltransferase family 39 protein [Campylobacterota bacterium]
MKKTYVIERKTTELSKVIHQKKVLLKYFQKTGNIGRKHMKTNKLLLWMQVITILPLTLFLLIYSKSDAFTLLVSFAAGGLLSLVAYNIYRYIKGRTIIHYPLVMVLMLSFFLYAITGLGSKEAPQAFESFKTNSGAATFTLEKPSQIDKFCYYVGIDKTASFSLEYLDQQKWKSLYSYEEKFPFSFRWKCQDINVTASQLRLRVTKKELMLGEVRFTHNEVPIAIKANKSILTDNPELTVDTSYFGGMFFDEIYHGRTAYELIHGLAVYENTHPYLGKVLISLGIEMFEMTPFGWRFINVVFGLFFIIVAYYFSLLLFKKPLFAFSGAFIVTYSFMHLVQARIALIDTFGVLFVFISYYFLYRFLIKQKLSLLWVSGIFFGLASAVKWSAVFASLGFVFIAIYLLIIKYPLEKRFAGYRLILYGVISYIGIALIVYTLTFFDIYMRTGNFQDIINYQINMFNYHAAAVKPHAYSSVWWSWIFDFRPMCYHRNNHGLMHQSITILGNPAIFWTGIVAILYLVYVSIRKRVLESGFILLAFLGMYLPYMFISRPMFIYHFYYAVPFMILAVLYMWRDLIEYSSKFYILFFLYLLIVAELFLQFYPVLSGYEVSREYVVNYLIWFKGWWL